MTNMQGTRRAKKRLAIAAAWVISLPLSGCITRDVPPFDPREITRANREGSEESPRFGMPALPTTMQMYVPSTQAAATRTSLPAPGEVRIVRMPIREVMQRAAANNPEVKVAGYDPAIAGTRVIEDAARYDPIAFTNLRYDKQFDRTPGTVIPNPINPSLGNVTIDVENNNIYTVESGVKQYLDSGGQISLSYQTQISDYSPVRFVRNNYWDNQLKLQLTQPLLREFGYEVNWARITVGRNDQRISVLDFRGKLEDNTNELEKDYWQLWQAQKEIEAQEELLEQTRVFADLLWRQYILQGRATILEASQGVSQLSLRQRDLLRAQAHAADLSDDIKRRMGDPKFPIAQPIQVLPADDPVTQPLEFELQDQINTALLNRLELGQQQLRINSADVARLVAENALLPKLDFVGTAALQGLSGNFGDSLSDQFGKGHMVYSLGLQLEIPLGNREAQSIYWRARLQIIQAMWEYRRLVNEISTDVSLADREVHTAWESIHHAQNARMYADQALTALNQRQESGQQPLDPEFVELKLQRQEELANAKRQEAAEIANYNIALARLEKAKGTILRYNNIVMEEDRLPWNVPLPR